MKKFLALLLTMMLVMSTFALTACGNNDPEPTPDPAPAQEAEPDPEPEPEDEPEPEEPEVAEDNEVSYIAVISKGFQHQFWQTVYAGALAAGEYYGVRVSFDGPPSEADIGPQLDMLRAALARNPDALAFAALDTEAALAELQDAYNRGIPVVGFDSGVPGAPAGQVRANAATDNASAGGIAADHMFPEIEAALAAATEDAPVVVAILSQDVTSESITERTRGFAERMYSLASSVNDSVAIAGGFDRINTGDSGAAVVIEVFVGATPDTVDMQTAAHGMLTNTNGLVGVFASNEGSVGGVLSSIVAGTVVPAEVPIIGFDAGSAQKGAVETGVMFGAVTQDPFQIGFQAVSLAVRAARGETVSDVDPGAKWWDASNMHDPEIAILLYD